MYAPTMLPRKTLLSAAALLIALTAFSSTAFAQRGRIVDVEFRDIDIYKSRRSNLTIDYKIRKSSWRRLRKLRISPTLHIHAMRTLKNGMVMDSTYSVALGDRRGRVEFPAFVSIYGDRNLEVSLTGKGRRGRKIGRVGINNTFGDQLEVKVRRSAPPNTTVVVHDDRPDTRPPVHDHPPHARPPIEQPPRNWRAETIKSCKAATRFKSEFDKCLQEALELPPLYAADTVRACGKQTRFASKLVKCLESARSIKPQNPADVVSACGNATTHGSELSSCIAKASQQRHPMVASTISACKASTRFNSHFNKCLDLTAGYRFKPSPVISACKKATRFDSDFQKCLGSGSQLGTDGPSIIAACGGGNHARNIDTCIDRAVRSDRRGRR